MQEKNMSGERAAAADSGPKPFVARVERPDGSVRLIGVSDAARWLGCSTVALGLAAREMPGRGRRLADRARLEFPGLFREQVCGLGFNPKYPTQKTCSITCEKELREASPHA